MITTDQQGMKFSIFFFSSESEENNNDKYGSLLKIAEFADERGFQAIWTPERHFHRFGGLYPNPSVLSAAIAARTKRIRIRAGSVLLPFHHPIRVAEDWSVIDNLSGGRVDISVAPGWHIKDSVFGPDVYEARREVMFERLETLQRLWRGESVPFLTASNEETDYKIYPDPIQPTLPIWVTSARSKETWKKAGRIGANILTALYGIDLEELKENIEVYREERKQHGHLTNGIVTVMLHTFIGENMNDVKETVREPFIQYLLSHVELFDINAIAKNGGIDPSKLSEKHVRALASYSFDRYFNNNALIGTLDSCSITIDLFAAMGVDEIACLIDFGVSAVEVFKSLEYIDRLQKKYAVSTELEAEMIS